MHFVFLNLTCSFGQDEKRNESRYLLEICFKSIIEYANTVILMKISLFSFFFSIEGYNELVTALQQLQGTLNKNGLASLAGRVTNVQSLLLGPVVARALHVRSAVLQRRRPRTQNAIRTNAKALAKEVNSSRNHKRRSMSCQPM